MTAPLLVLGWGNASRGDDALGPLLVQGLRATLTPADGVECLDDYQLQPEHALDLVGRRQVLLVDASRTARAPFEVRAVQAGRDASYATHAMSPQALLQVYADIHPGEAPPPCTLLAISGRSFELGAPASADALGHLAAALPWAQAWVRRFAGPAAR